MRTLALSLPLLLLLGSSITTTTSSSTCYTFDIHSEKSTPPPPPAIVETDEDTQFELPRIVPAWRFGGPGSGMVECLLRGVSGAATGQFVAPRVAFDDDARHLIAALPSPRHLSPGRYHTQS